MNNKYYIENYIGGNFYISVPLFFDHSNFFTKLEVSSESVQHLIEGSIHSVFNNNSMVRLSFCVEQLFFGNELSITDFKYTLKINEQNFDIYVSEAINLSLKVNQLGDGELKVFSNILDYKHTDLLVNKYFYQIPTPSVSKDNKNSICVITNANSAGAWFPYFHSHYSNLVGSSSIYVVTSNPNGFEDFDLGGLLTIPGGKFDETVRRVLMSNLANGLRSIYRWVLVCDVDELLSVHPACDKSFIDLLEINLSKDNQVVAAIGVDVIQVDGESDFNFSKKVSEQRSVGVLNSFISKPYLSSTNVHYVEGFHTCSHRTILGVFPDVFISHHLKYACKKISNEIISINSQLLFSDPSTGDYMVRSNTYNKHPFFDLNLHLDYPTVNIFSKEVDDFCAGFLKSFYYDLLNKIFRYKYKMYSNFLVKIN